MRRLCPPSALALVIVCTACGARSSLLQEQQPAEPIESREAGPDGVSGAAGYGTGGVAGAAGHGTGGAAGSAGYGTGGISGHAGSWPLCSSLSVARGPTRVAPDPSILETAPLLAAASSDESEIALAMHGNGSGASPLFLLTMQPWSDGSAWGSWQPATASFVSAPGQTLMERGITEGSVHLVYPASPSPPADQPKGLFILPVDAASGTSLANAVSIPAAGQSQRARFIARSGQNSLIGYQSKTDETRQLHLVWFDGSAVTPYSAPVIGCGNQYLSAEAVSAGDRWLIAYSSAAGQYECLNGIGDDRPPGGLWIKTLLDDGSSSDELLTEISDDAVSMIRIAAHDQGAWIVWQYAGLLGPMSTIRAALIDRNGKLRSGPFDITDPTDHPREGSVVAARLGNKLAISYIEDGTHQWMYVRIVDEQGQATPGYDLKLDPENGGWFRGATAMRSSPDGSSLLLAWDQVIMGAEGVYVARLECGTP